MQETLMATTNDQVAAGSPPDALISDIHWNTSAARVTRAAFEAILDGRRLSRDDLLQLTGASAAELDRLVGRALVLDADDRIVAAHGLSLVSARQHRVEPGGARR
jgi:hypothetical protein